MSEYELAILVLFTLGITALVGGSTVVWRSMGA